VGAAGSRVRVISPWRESGFRWQAAKRSGLGWRGPALWASGVSELRQWGRQVVQPGRSVVGLADETSERGRLCGISLVRSSRRQPSTTERPGGDDPPQGGGRTGLLCGRTDVRELWRLLTGRKHRINGWSKLSRRKITQALTRVPADGAGIFPEGGSSPMNIRQRALAHSWRVRHES
jgi:hypothetical protein